MPANPATISAAVIGGIIRGEIGFDGLLISDDISMKALSGDFAARASGNPCRRMRCRTSLQRRHGGNAGGGIAACTSLSGKALDRAERALAGLGRGDDTDEEAARAEFAGLVGKDSAGERLDDGTVEVTTVDRRAGQADPHGRAVGRQRCARLRANPRCVVDVAGFEGPLDLLLHLARNQKVDLARISVLALAEQYLVFVEQARALRLELAADYLVMAAWLAYLKSRLLIPKQEGDEEESGEEMAAILQFRLKRLEAMRDAAARLVNRNRLGRDVFARGMPEAVIVDRRNRILGLALRSVDRLRLAAPAPGGLQCQDRQSAACGRSRRRAMSWSGWSAKLADWTALDRYLVEFLAIAEDRATVIASSFAASLEMVREGHIEIRQERAFAPLYLRNRVRFAAGDEVRR